jgi:lipopolysaccharide biosynthesis glycosyltransferase
LLRKIAARREVLTHATGKRYRQAVFLCTDLNYLCATFVALHSITRAIDPRHTDFFIIAEDAAVTLARASARAFLDANIQLTIVPASDIIGTAQRLLPEYGLFTSGHRLSSAAYYRIFFAQHLKKRGLHDRALYIDSDTLLTMPADTLLRTDLGGHALAARIEMPRPDVRRAITHHGLAAGRYFNSGVLLLDLLHPDLEAALLKTIDSVADETVTLLYHDQCALNLGFRDRFFDLDMAWNMPVTEATRLADIPPDAAILHFLDRPKPWSAAYNGEAGPLWFEKFQAAAAFIGEATAVTLFAEITD